MPAGRGYAPSPDCLRRDGRVGSEAVVGPRWERLLGNLANDALGGCLLGRRLYETMLVWETDPSLRDNEPGAAFADARLAEASLAEEIAAALDATDKDVEVGGAGLAAQAIELGLVDELRMFRKLGRRRWRHAVPPTGPTARSPDPPRAPQADRLA